MMKIEMPREPNVERLWTEPASDDHHEGPWVEWTRIIDPEREGAHWEQMLDGDMHFTWRELRAGYDHVYTTHPDLAVLDKYPAPFTVSPAGTIRDATGKAVLDPNQQCPPCLTRFFMRAANFFAEHYDPSAGEDEKR